MQWTAPSFTTSARASLPKCNSRIAMTIQASAAESNPASGVIFVATNTSNNVAVLRTLPEMVSSACGDDRGLLCWRVQAVTHVVVL
jgi:hypothetical protein